MPQPRKRQQNREDRRSSPQPMIRAAGDKKQSDDGTKNRQVSQQQGRGRRPSPQPRIRAHKDQNHPANRAGSNRVSHENETQTRKKVRFNKNHSYNPISNTCVSKDKKRPPRRYEAKRRGRSDEMEHLNILYANARGITGKIESLISALQTHNTHIATITETKLGGIPPGSPGIRGSTRTRTEGKEE